MADIKLFVCCHQPNEVPKHPLLVPIQVGTALAVQRFEGFLHDDVGENISVKNRSYCELTAQYWAWKNIDADYYGFFHYRRYLYPKASERLPYRIEGTANRILLEWLDFNKFERLIPQYDLIAPIGEDMHIPVREHYIRAPFHCRKDLELVEQIIQECYPEYLPAMEQYLSQSVCYFGNIYIMKRQLFRDYCGWLFSILEEFDQRVDLTGYSPQELRVNGYLAERLFGIWLTHVRDSLCVCELPRVHFVPESAARKKRKLVNLLLPPGSRRRNLFKAYTYRKGGAP